MKLTVLLPIFNEERELACLDRVLASIAAEVIAVDDCSTEFPMNLRSPAFG